MLILGVDPGTARLGWGIIQGKNGEPAVKAFGCLETGKNKSEPERLNQLFDNLIKLIKKFKPDSVAIEALFFFKNQKTVIQIGQARGIILLACQKQGIKVFSYSPLQIKMAVTGYGRADKRQVQEMTKAILKLAEIPKPDDAADALAVALTHAFSQKLKSALQ